MSLRRQVVGLVLASAVAMGLNVALGTVGVVVYTRWHDAVAMEARVAEAWPACADDPAGWSVQGHGFEAFAYDPATGAAANPRAPGRLDDLAAFRPMSWVEQRGEGPCGEVVVRGVLGLSRTPFPLGLILAVGVPGLVAVGAGAWIGRRFVARMEALVDGTQGLGEPDGFAPGPAAGDDELGQLAAALERAHARILADADALRARQQATERHLWAVAHDLRTPLAHLQVQLEGLPASDGVAVARSELGYLVALVDNLHQQARLDGGLAPLEQGHAFDLGQTARRLELRFRMLGALQGVDLSGAWPDAPLEVVGDEDLVERALGNLLHNALRHGATQVGFTLDAVGDGFRFVVRDDGPGLPEAVAQALHEGTELPRGAARTRGQGGLGLPIVREVVARHGWRLVVEAGGEGEGAVLAVEG